MSSISHDFRTFVLGIRWLLEPLTYSTMKIFIDNGHGADTAGKRSPNGRFLEYKFNRSA